MEFKIQTKQNINNIRLKKSECDESGVGYDDIRERRQTSETIASEAINDSDDKRVKR